MPAKLELPVISISPYLSPSSTPAQRAEVSSALHRACRDIGFFYLRVDDMLEAGEMREVLDLGRKFFALPKEEKERIGLAYSDGARGYQRLHENVTQGKADHHEGVDFYAPSPHPPTHDSSTLARTDRPLPLSGQDLYPTQPVAFKPTYLSWVSKMKQLGLTVMRAMADGLGMTSEEWEELRGMVEDSFWVMRVIGYPELPSGAEGISCGEHKDYGCLTLLHADSTPRALQVFLRPTPVPGQASRPESEGQWIDADPKEGCFVVNVGEMWEIWSNGMYKSTLHRVIHRSPTYRVSLPFFYEPTFHAQIKPLAAALRVQQSEGWVLPEGKEYDQVTYGEFLVGKVSGNFDESGRKEKY